MRSANDSAELPSLSHDPAFFGFLGTQFLGAFNDNVFKQMVLLLCVTEAARRQSLGEIVSSDGQGLVIALFAGPFVLFSGLAGYLSDKFSKRRIVVLSKVAEVAIMALAAAAFIIGAGQPALRLKCLMLVLGLMGTQSAFFGPAKYGILPELFRDRDLPAANGLIQMTTFLAIIFGAALAGFLIDWYGDALWIAAGYCVGLAVLGTFTSLLVRKTPIAQPNLTLTSGSLWITADVRRMLWEDRPLLNVLLISSVFWFVGGITQLAANAFGSEFLGWTAGRTSLLVASIGFGICLGCVVASRFSRDQINFGVARCGSFGLVAGFLWLSSFGIRLEPANANPPPTVSKPALAKATSGPHKNPADVESRESLWQLAWPKSALEVEARAAMFFVGMAAGLFIVPLQVFLQTRPPADQKGRMIGAMNLINWCGIVLSGGIYFAITAILKATSLPSPGLWLVLAVCLLPVAIFYRPPNEKL